jgi:DNA modification methylase
VRAVVHIGNVMDILPTLADQSVNCCVTSPPYWGLRDYGTDGQLGLEPTPEAYVAKMVAVFREVWRVLRDDGTLWLNLGDSYNNRSVARPSSHQGGLGFENESINRSWADGTKLGLTRLSLTGGDMKEKDLVGIPWMVAFALRADGWYLRSDIIWAKPNPMPESVTDRPTKAHEYVFLMSKAARYWYDGDAVKERSAEADRVQSDKRLSMRQNRGVVSVAGLGQSSKGVDGGAEPTHTMSSGMTVNRRTVWTIATQPYPEAHFATYPEKLVEPCVLAGCPAGGTVLDPFTGSGTTGAVACRLGRNFIGIELNPEYAEMAERRIAPHRDQMQLAVEW